MCRGTAPDELTDQGLQVAGAVSLEVGLDFVLAARAKYVPDFPSLTAMGLVTAVPASRSRDGHSAN